MRWTADLCVDIVIIRWYDFYTIQKSDDEDGTGRAFFREPGAVEARQTAAGVPIPSELKSPKRLSK